MCEDCFKKEILKFDSQEDFDVFQRSIDIKINEKKLRTIRDENHKNWDFKLIYQCVFCNEEWILSIPDNAWRGYFLTKNNAIKRDKELESERKKGSIGCFIILSLILLIIIILTIKACG